MPKHEIDYSNTIIYKITCKDINIKDVYVGHTTNFVQRKHSHKQCCKKDSSKVYEVIRANGGWNNWHMEIISFYNCKDHHAARIKEQEYFISLNANLNSIEPLPKSKQTINNKKKINQSISTDNVSESKNENKIKKKSENENMKRKYECIMCNIGCNKKTDWDRHILTRKHSFNQLNNIESVPKIFTCKKCDKIYKSRKGLWGHYKTCDVIKNNDIMTKDTKDENIESLIKHNTDINNMILDMVKNHIEIQKQIIEICMNRSGNIL